MTSRTHGEIPAIGRQVPTWPTERGNEQHGFLRTGFTNHKLALQSAMGAETARKTARSAFARP
jgi:hypothetical protein